ncbi:SAM-dependent methyltransferase [Aliidiomarina sedimenti]|uniref:tRNA (guanine(46)-N(7))-methyltransferase n=1 Tax=Aliidiomarina sedimenti TaxID=1933879 RepID=A0ABY0BUK7_9GAMM|nr:SAM-dependent methyltransferase [Aliidiomarina sedimenti]RUO27933.1 SAM-dependent methyltransferase [Aliidiomarina sedimenti]
MMEYQSRGIDTNQTGIHEDLDKTVRKYLSTEFQKPVAEHSKATFEQVQTVVDRWQGPLILDSCCGVGESTLALSQRHPEALVVGIDKSAHRLGKNTAYGDSNERCLLVRADLNDFWRQAVDAKWQLSRHYILYPNPWPKQKHLQRRWHGGPLFPSIIALGGQLELRSNWRLYLEEFARALEISGHASSVTELAADSVPITPFERKYQATQQALWQLQSKLC